MAKDTRATPPRREEHVNVARPRPGRRPKPAPLVPRVKVWLETEGQDYALGFGLSTILQAVDRAGSIKQAAGDLGKSYRYVWGRIKEAERALGRRLVATQVGGKDTQRSALTPEARRLTEEFLAIRRHLIGVVEQEFARRLAWPLLIKTGRP
jgi:molybdate transport system regulatory protein